MAMSCTVETITRETAVKYLAMRGSNRTLNAKHVENLAARQRRGEWIPNGDTIRFDTDDLLRDGQHRLEMVVQTDVPIETVVVRGLNPRAFVTMDTGRNRGLSDVLSIEGYDNSGMLASAVKMVYSVLRRRRSVGGPSVSSEQYMQALEKHSRIVDSLDYYQGVDKNNAPNPPGTMIAAHYLFSLASPESANDFMDGLLTGLHLDDSDDPVMRLRTQLQGYKPRRALKPQPMQIFDLIVLAWNAKQTGRPQRVNYRLVDSTPTIRGLDKKFFEVGQQELAILEAAADEEEELAAD